MIEAAVIGSPVSHSRSPAIFSFLASQLERADFKYSAIDVPPAELAPFLTDLRRRSNFVGANVTLPHKETILRLLDEVAPEARAVGAVNVVHAQEGRLLGYNTDVLGVVQTLIEQNCLMQGADAWVWGAGGAARAVAYALCRFGARSVYLQNRDPARAAKLQDELGALFPSTSIIVARPDTHQDAQPISLVVNATPLGMKGAAGSGASFENMRKLPLKRDALAFDLIYNPERTSFLTLAEELDLRTVSGLDMLIYQALATWEIWCGPLGSDVQARELKNALLRHLRERPIFLTGFMGVGKSVVGAALASKLGWEYLDTDELIVRKAGMPVPKIFDSIGEQGFRKLESAAVLEAAQRHRVVVSLGGGALMNPECLTRVEQAGSLVCLDASVEYLQNRLIGATSRPLLAGLGKEELGLKIESMLQERKPVYERALFRINAENARPAEIADGVIRLLFNEAGFRSVAGRPKVEA